MKNKDIKKTNKVKKVHRYFRFGDFNKAEDFLQQMHKDGWRLKKCAPFDIYSFELCEPEEYIYRIDYQIKKAGSDYYNLFKDCGWTFVCSNDGYNYFCKRKDFLSENDSEIFCDYESKIDMIRKALFGNTLPKLLFVVLVNIPWIILTALLANTFSFYKWLGIIYLVLLAIYLISILTNSIEFLLFEKKVQGETKSIYKVITLGVICAATMALATWGTIEGSNHYWDDVYTQQTDEYGQHTIIDATYLNNNNFDHLYKLKKGETVTISVELTRGSTTIEIYDTLYDSKNQIANENNLVFFRKINKSEGTYTFVATDDGQYIVKLFFKRAKGHFEINID